MTRQPPLCADGNAAAGKPSRFAPTSAGEVPQSKAKEAGAKQYEGAAGVQIGATATSVQGADSAQGTAPAAQPAVLVAGTAFAACLDAFVCMCRLSNKDK